MEFGRYVASFRIPLKKSLSRQAETPIYKYSFSKLRSQAYPFAFRYCLSRRTFPLFISKARPPYSMRFFRALTYDVPSLKALRQIGQTGALPTLGLLGWRVKPEFSYSSDPKWAHPIPLPFGPPIEEVSSSSRLRLVLALSNSNKGFR